MAADCNWHVLYTTVHPLSIYLHIAEFETWGGVQLSTTLQTWHHGAHKQVLNGLFRVDPQNLKSKKIIPADSR